MGMTRAEMESALPGAPSATADSDWAGCRYITVGRLPPGARVMVENGTVARIDVDSGSVATVEGARVGDSEERIRQLYPRNLASSPHKYTDGHNLTFTPAESGDSLYRIVFETDGHRVVRYRAGRVPPVEYVEGCG
ncbi:MAG: hypothetical protein JWO05_2809 [Gemmatimonadetes bacterium]|nr:hypothetical protein [Gemmatimonadota bacterium]